MSLFAALTTSVAGLQAQSFSMENISDNIANSRTAGYKRVESSFMDMVSQGARQMQQGGSVAYRSRTTNGVAGAINATGMSTNVALSGDGFITVQQRIQGANGTVFTGSNLFTRRGDFVLDQDGYLVNGSDNYLVGRPLDPATGLPTGAIPSVLRIAPGFSPPNRTSTMSYVGNLPATPKTPNYVASTAGSDIWTAGVDAPALVTATSTPSAASFASNSIDGQSVRMYDSVGNARDVNLRWAKLGPGADAGSTKWALYYDSNPGTTAATTEWSLVSTVTFNASGAATEPTAPIAVDLTSRGLGSVAIDLSGRNLTQYADQSGQPKITTLAQNGYPAGTFTGLDIDSEGKISGTYSNGQSRPLALLSIAQFAAPEMLKRGSGSAFEATSDSGVPIFDAGTTQVQAGAVEGSNTDVAEEFSKMIVTQQAYSANTRVMSSLQDMMKEVMNVIR